MKEAVSLDRAEILAVHDMIFAQHRGVAGVYDEA